jgi:tRNA dimethylallyltransferase
VARVAVIAGPTASGKSALAVALARRVGGELVNADSQAVYRGLDVGTAKPTAAERAAVPHHLLDVVEPGEGMDAARFQALADAAVAEIAARGRVPIVVGGTGLYLRAALAELDLRPPVPPEVRERYAGQPAAALHEQLQARDPEAAARTGATDRRRLARALELLDAGHAPPGGDQLWTTETRHPTLLAGLTRDREDLYARIDARVDAMVARGAIEEVRRADAAGASASARQALGFAELRVGDVEAMKTRTRRYARRQLTWMRKLPGVHLLDLTGRGSDAVAAELLGRLRGG